MTPVEQGKHMNRKEPDHLNLLFDMG
ncbi:MAG: hypothetical protein QG618_2158, partial [Thermodesulfobacteriota bacterium]|nr:hypothetical protein [Thermodesulfobacteriota bacterium]